MAEPSTYTELTTLGALVSMQTFGAFICTLVAASGLAAALPATQSAEGFTVLATRNPDFKPNALRAARRTLLKYNKSLPGHDELEAAAAHVKIPKLDEKVSKRWTGHVVTSPQPYDIEYLTEVHIGTPAQKLQLDIDTGSSDLWVFSTETPKDQVKGQALYNPKKSQSAKKLDGATWDIQYGDGSSSSGDVYLDNVSIGGLRIKGQAIESALTVSETFTENSACSGLLGLAFSSLNTVKPNQQLTFLDTAKPHMKAPLFTADLNYHANGTYRFGYIEKTDYKGAITYTPVDNSQGFWSFTSPGYSFNGIYKDTALSGIADTGTTLLYLPEDVVEAYYGSIPGAMLYIWEWLFIYPCSEKLPDFSYQVEGSTVTIPGEYLNYAEALEDNGITYCLGGLQSSLWIGINIFGDMGLKSSLVVFDEGNMRLGFAAK
ncbi:peptidase A1 [Purpureocillium lavendulum]|uniref:Peptidase A1 n=1 Tax=Purpureocillium lavendulum TaxID=1247861 RepID=A0AB34FRS9_9HYPO|nr:peptidase A1 [Purpureocillium lavendulum]